MNLATLSNDLRRLAATKEVIIINAEHPKFGALGVTAGLADTVDTARVRVLVDGAIYLCAPSDIAEN
ncbi:hypothetical protein [Achromobacter xylosoxidans]|uniref:hypothetical protein n=1 Tax=Alcaligenes xylosoxydans xylosoxydans TaxID=85698 RepID=UPI002930C4C7|nr:hypothetical protein [Achromobacter xylosoxidans]WOB74089.1 hypothetical protein PZA07_01000 [Achromobacter xylosoxidans]